MKNKKTNNLKFLGVVFLSMLVLFITIASAETGETPAGDTTATESVSSAGAQAIATGSEAIASTQVTITSDGASASATSKAKAENGDTATAVAEAWANWVDGSSAYARSVATAVAGIGETIWAEAYASASISEGEARAETEAYVGTDPDHIDHNNGGEDPNNGGGDPNNGGGDPNNGKIVPETPRPDAISGFIFGKSDIERYCTYKLQMTDDNPDNDHRAEYYLNIIAWDYGFKDKSEFESKYNIECTTKISAESEEVLDTVSVSYYT